MINLLQRLAVMAVALGLGAGTLAADDDGPQPPITLRPVASAYTFNIGGAQLADTYLTPIIYNGWNLGFRYQRMQPMAFSPEKWVMQLSVGIQGGRTLNGVGNSTMWRGQIAADWAMMRRWKLPCKLTVGVGGYTALNAGALYLSRNGNNPASAKGAWTIGATAYATYPLKIGKMRTLLRWQGSLPVTGIFFSPDYGELYYEIWLGNHSGLVHGAWFGNYLQINNEVTADIALGSTWLRLGYRSEVLSTKVNDITSRIVTNSFVVGLTTEWLSISPSKLPGANARVISALY